MKKPLISVIVPVYNVEKYLRECLNTILCQTYSNLEIICVNDGSTDKSREILEEYSKKDCRIKIVDKENGGLSSARNAGMKVATGEYISFIDSDDWIDKTMIEKLYNSMETYNTDITICAVHQFDERKQEYDDYNPYFTLGYFDESFDNRAFTYKDTKPFIMDVCVMAWNKLYRRKLTDECGAEFPEGLIFEDGPFFFSIFFKAKRLSIVREYLYFYRINRKGSIVHKAGKKFLNVIDVINLMYSHVKDLDDYLEIRPLFFGKKVEDCLSRLDNMSSRYKSAYAKKIKNDSILCNEELFPDYIVKGSFKYNHYLFKTLKKGSILKYELLKLKMRLMYKTMEIMYCDNDFYLFKINGIKLKIRKNKDILEIYYVNDILHFKFFNKKTIKVPFKFSELEQLNDND